jgi:hypothetical protein
MSRTHGTRQAGRPASKAPEAPTVAEVRSAIRCKFPDLSVRLAGSKKTGLLVLVPGIKPDEAVKPRTAHVELDIDPTELASVRRHLGDLAHAERRPGDMAPEAWWQRHRDEWTLRALTILEELHRAAQKAGPR